jgi:hypothetical protein
MLILEYEMALLLLLCLLFPPGSDTHDKPWLQLYQESRTTIFTPAYAILGMGPFNCNIVQHWVHFSIHT